MLHEIAIAIKLMTTHCPFTYNYYILDSLGLQKRMEIGSKESTETCLHYLIIPFFDHQTIHQFRTLASLGSWAQFSSTVSMPAKKFNISSQWVMLSNNLNTETQIPTMLIFSS